MTFGPEGQQFPAVNRCTPCLIGEHERCTGIDGSACECPCRRAFDDDEGDAVAGPTPDDLAWHQDQIDRLHALHEDDEWIDE